MDCSTGKRFVRGPSSREAARRTAALQVCGLDFGLLVVVPSLIPTRTGHRGADGLFHGPEVREGSQLERQALISKLLVVVFRP